MIKQDVKNLLDIDPTGAVAPEASDASPGGDLLQSALEYASMVVPVFPCRSGSKIPATEHGFKDATTDEFAIRAWWTKNPRFNIGMPTGAVSGLIVIDVDPRHGGPIGLDALEARHGRLPSTAEGISGDGGRHLFFKYPTGPGAMRVPCSQSKIAPGVDVKGDGGYVILPPSLHPNGKNYAWELSSKLGEVLPADCPDWLLALIVESDAPATKAPFPDASNPIPAGQRNSTLMRLAGGMRRMGMSADEIGSALETANRARCNPPLDACEVFRVAANAARYEPDQMTTASVESHWEQMQAAANEPPFISVRQLVADHPEMRIPVIHGLLRRGESMNVVSASKIGKSWLVLDLALSIVTGRPWLRQFQCEQGQVLILDNELHLETLANRIPSVAQAKGLTPDQYADRLFVRTLRGQLRDLLGLRQYFEQLEPNRFKVIICDAFYRFLPPGTDENDNGSMANLYNVLDNFATHTGSSFVLIHHSSKGNQSLKSITDVGSGAGSLGRAADAHIAIRRHEEDNVVVFEGEVRAWPKIIPQCLRWDFPLWSVAPDLDPTRLRSEKPGKKKEEAADWTPESFAGQFVTSEPRSRSAILSAAVASGLSNYKAERLVRQAEAEGHIHRWEIGRNRPSSYATVQPPEQERSEA